MNKWTKHVIMKSGVPVTVYVDAARHQAYVFPLFGKYYDLYTDGDVLDMATDFLLGTESNVITFQGYMNGFEDTAVIQIDKIAA